MAKKTSLGQFKIAGCPYPNIAMAKKTSLGQVINSNNSNNNNNNNNKWAPFRLRESGVVNVKKCCPSKNKGRLGRLSY